MEQTAAAARELDRTLEESVQYTYDDNGNRISRTQNGSTTEYTFDSGNRMTAVEESESRSDYIYDEDGLRVAESVNGEVTTYLYDKLQSFPRVVEERSPGATVMYEWGEGIDPVALVRDSEVSFYLTDGSLNVRQLVDDNATVTDAYDLDAFGGVLRRTGSTPNRFLLHGQQYDANAGYYYMRARWMDPAAGGFVSLDPVSGNPLVPISLHKYLFASGNPVMGADPSGLFNLTEVMVGVTILMGLILAVLAIIANLVGQLLNGGRGYVRWAGTQVSSSLSTGLMSWGATAISTESDCQQTWDTNEWKVGVGVYYLMFSGLSFGWDFDFSLSSITLVSPFFFGPDPNALNGLAMLVGGGAGVGVAGVSWGGMLMMYGSTTDDSVIGLTAASTFDIPGVSQGLIAGFNIIGILGGWSIEFGRWLYDCDPKSNST
jgi:RHS repeat-associated protein